MSYQLTMREEFDCNRDARDIFDYIVDFSRIDEWDQTIISAEKVSAGAIQQGSKFDLMYAMGLRRVPIQYEITEYDSPHRAVLTGKSRNFTAVDTVEIVPGENGCHVNWTAQIEFLGAAAKLVPLMESKIIAAGSQTIKNLAKALDDNYPVPELNLSQKLADQFILPGVLGFSTLGLNRVRKLWQPVTASMRGKHVVITGATSGLGLATAHELAHRGAELTLVVRDQAKADAVVQEIEESTGNSSLQVELADLSLMQDVIALGERMLAQGKPIDVLINNAGALLNPRQETTEGIETSFALLLLGPYILTEMLQPLLRDAGQARVINVSSGGMYGKRISLSNLESTKGEYGGADAYARAKRGLVIMGERWAEHWAQDGITVHNMHPGWAKTPGVETSLPGFTKITNRILRTPEEGADTIIWLANATEVGKTSGLFWFDRFPHTTHLTGNTRETAEQRDALERALIEYWGRFNAKAA